jgi:SulP family sulfate permease
VHEVSGRHLRRSSSLPKGVEVFRFAGPMFFGVARAMLDAVRRSGRKSQIIILRMDHQQVATFQTARDRVSLIT